MTYRDFIENKRYKTLTLEQRVAIWHARTQGDRDAAALAADELRAHKENDKRDAEEAAKYRYHQSSLFNLD